MNLPITFSAEIQRMPSINVPDVAGLHSNLSIKYSENCMQNTWQCLSKIQAKEGMIFIRI